MTMTALMAAPCMHTYGLVRAGMRKFMVQGRCGRAGIAIVIAVI